MVLEIPSGGWRGYDDIWAGSTPSTERRAASQKRTSPRPGARSAAWTTSRLPPRVDCALPERPAQQLRYDCARSRCRPRSSSADARTGRRLPLPCLVVHGGRPRRIHPACSGMATPPWLHRLRARRGRQHDLPRALARGDRRGHRLGCRRISFGRTALEPNWRAGGQAQPSGCGPGTACAVNMLIGACCGSCLTARRPTAMKSFQKLVADGTMTGAVSVCCRGCTLPCLGCAHRHAMSHHGQSGSCRVSSRGSRESWQRNDAEIRLAPALRGGDRYAIPLLTTPGSTSRSRGWPVHRLRRMLRDRPRSVPGLRQRGPGPRSRASSVTRRRRPSSVRPRLVEKRAASRPAMAPVCLLIAVSRQQPKLFRCCSASSATTSRSPSSGPARHRAAHDQTSPTSAGTASITRSTRWAGPSSGRDTHLRPVLVARARGRR